MIKEEVEIDNRIHKYIIGRRGDEIKKIQKKFNVELRLPRDGDPNPDLVTIMGDEDGVLDCKDELLNIQEEYLQDEIDRESLQKLAPTRARDSEKEPATITTTYTYSALPLMGATQAVAVSV